MHIALSQKIAAPVAFYMEGHLEPDTEQCFSLREGALPFGDVCDGRSNEHVY